jgi:hypothetical protein
MTKRRPITQLPVVHQTSALKRFFGSTVDQLFQPGRAEPVSGYIGRVPSYNDPIADFYKQEPTPERLQYQLESSMTSFIDGELSALLFYDDLISRLNAMGANTTDVNRLLKSEYWTWAPPVDIDKLNNSQQWYWSGNDVPTLDLTLPGMDLPKMVRGNGVTRNFDLPVIQENMTLLSEHQNIHSAYPAVLVNGSLVPISNFNSTTVTLVTPPIDNAIVEIYRYGNISDGFRTDFAVPDVFNTDLSFDPTRDIHVYVNGRETTDFTFVEGYSRIRLSGAAAQNAIVTVTMWNSIEAICENLVSVNISSINQHGVDDLITGLKVRLIDPVSYFKGFDIKPNDTFKWDEGVENVYYVDGVGSDIEFIPAQLFSAIDPQYVVCSRQDKARSYWSRINRWVSGEALEWFSGKTQERQAKRAICEYVPNLKLWNYGTTRGPDVDLVFGVLSDRTITNLVNLQDDAGRSPRSGDTILFGEVGNPDLDLKVFRWPTIDDFSTSINLIELHSVQQGDVFMYIDTPNEYVWDDVWKVVEHPGDFPLFDLYDNNGVSLGDLGEYPETTFQGSRIFCYEVGDTGYDDQLGFAVKYDTYGQIMFENDLFTKRYSFRDGEMNGYYYYKINNEFFNQWYKADGFLPPVDGELTVPLNLQANPNFETPTRISRNNWFNHFSSIVSNQDGFQGAAYSKNNWKDTAKDLSKGTEIIQSRAPLLKLMLLVSDLGFDPIPAIEFAEREYVRLKAKIRQQVNESLAKGLYNDDTDYRSTLITILRKLANSKTVDFAFYLSLVGGDHYFIPPTPSTMGIIPMNVPKIISEYGEDYILGHDGSKTALTHSLVLDNIMLELEKLIFESTQDVAFFPDRLAELPESSLRSGKWRISDYSLDEYNAILQGRFENWARTNGLDYQTNNTYDPDNPFTWNYSALFDAEGDKFPGGWRAIYRHYFDTESPHLTPWEMLGFVNQPDWWIDEYGPAPYIRTNPMWIDIQDGRIRYGERIGINPQFARPTLLDVLPIDLYGNLLDPVEANIVKQTPTEQFASQSWVFGEGGPVETLWRRSSSYSFALSSALFLMRPAQFVEHFWDVSNTTLVQDQWVNIDTNKRSSHAELILHGEDENGVTKSSIGIQAYLVELMIHRGQRPSILGDLIRGLDVRLAHKMAGFTTSDRMIISAESFGLIPQEDITISLYRAPSVDLDYYSGVIIEKLADQRWRVVGYNSSKPHFRTRPSDPNGKKKIIYGNAQDERVVNPWTPNVYYKVGMLVINNGVVYEVIKPHFSINQFEPVYWVEAEAQYDVSNNIYHFTDLDGSEEIVPYTTIYNSVQDVVNFIFAYASDLNIRGFAFPNSSWDIAVDKFINWTTVDWDNGAFITLSPAARAIEYSTQYGYVMDLNNPFETNMIVNRTGHAIDHRNLNIDRMDDVLSIEVTSDDDLYGIVLKKSAVEHALVFSNRTIFNDIIYDPVYNVRQDRLKMSARVTTDWAGRYNAPGFIISNGQIVSNFDKSSDDIRYAFDIELADNSVFRDSARHLIGFEPRSYLDNLLLNDTQQFELYQGMIQQKGTIGSLNKIMRSKAVEGNRDIRFAEEWAFRLDDFGAYEPRRYQEISLLRSDIRRQNQVLRLGNAVLPIWHPLTPYSVGFIITHNGVQYTAKQTHVSESEFTADDWIIDNRDNLNGIINISPTGDRWISNSSNYSDIMVDKSEAGSLPTAGYARIGEATYMAPDFNKFNELIKADIEQGKIISAGQSVWLYNRDHNGWGIDYFDHPTDSFGIHNYVPNSFAKWDVPLVETDIVSDVLISAKNRYQISSNAMARAPVPVLANTLYGFDLVTFFTDDFDGSLEISIDWKASNGSSIAITSDTVLKSGKFSVTRVSPANAVLAEVSLIATVNTGSVFVADPRMSYLDNAVSIIEIEAASEFNDVEGVRFILSHDHNLAIDDLVVISGPILDNYDAVGAFEISAIGSNWIEIVNIDGDVPTYNFAENDEVGPSIYSFLPARYPNQPSDDRLVGSIVYVDNDLTGNWAVYQYPDFEKKVRQQPQIVDVSKIASVKLYEKSTRLANLTMEPEALILASINPCDPITGTLVGIADREIDYKLEYDPANYESWAGEFIGRVWWDISTTWFINPYTDVLQDSKPYEYKNEIEYRANNWSKIAPNSSISLYEWTKSSVEPSLYNGEVYSLDEFVTTQEYDASKGRDIDVYYFWVKNPTSIPNVDFRKTSLSQVAAILGNPVLAGIPCFSPISEDEIVISGIGDYLNDATTVLQIMVQDSADDEDKPHAEWKLVRQGDGNTIPDSLWNKLKESLVTLDVNMQPIPSLQLHPMARVGNQKGQALFASEDLNKARETFITKINYLLSTKTFGDANFDADAFSFKSDYPDLLFWVSTTGVTELLLPPATMYDEIVTDTADLDIIGEKPYGYRILLDNRHGSSPSWSVWENTPTGKTVAPTYHNIVEDRTEFANIVPILDEYTLIKEDSQYNGFWTLWKYNGVEQILVWAQQYDTTDFWEYADWYDTDYSFDNPPIVSYESIAERNLNESPVTNRLVKIMDNGSGYWIWTAYLNDSWNIVAKQDGTIQLRDLFYTRDHVYGVDGFENPSNRNGIVELRVLFDQLINGSILLPIEKNDLWFTMVNYVHTRNDFVNWAFKTSFMSVIGFNEELLPTPVAKLDNTDNIIRYIDEVKPYHVTIREFTRNFNASEDANTVVTDFDYPLYYDEELQSYRKLDPLNPDDLEIMEAGQWEHWLANMDKARKTTISMKLDRVWFDDNGPSSGAANRIMNFYNPSGNMPAKDLQELLNLEFGGQVVEGLMNQPHDGEIYSANGTFEDGSTGLAMRDPRVAENTPEELIRLGAHDIFLLMVRDNWGAGSPKIDIKYFDVTNETAADITFDIGRLARSVIVIRDGKRVPVSEVIFSQLSNQVTVERNGGKTIAIISFGYAGHSAIMWQEFKLAESTQVTVPLPSLTNYGIEVTANGNKIPHTISSGSIVVNASIGDHVVFTAYKGAANSTVMKTISVPALQNPITSDTVSMTTVGSSQSGNSVEFDLLTNRSYSFSGSQLIINNLANSTFSSHAVQFLCAIQGTDLVVTRDTAALSAGDKFRALQIRNINNMTTVVATIGTSGVYSGSITLTATTIPEIATVKALHNKVNEESSLVVIYQDQIMFLDLDGNMISRYENIAWNSSSLIIPCAQTPQHMSALMVSSNRLEIIKFVDLGTISLQAIHMGNIEAMGTMILRTGFYDYKDNAVVLFADRTEGGSVVFKMSLETNHILWETWSGHNGEAVRFSCPSSVEGCKLTENRYFVWGNNNGLWNIDVRNGAFTNLGASSIPTNASQAWNEDGLLYVLSTTNIQKYVVELTLAGFPITYMLPQKSLNYPYASSMIVERNGSRLHPPKMIHMINKIYSIGSGFQNSIMIDDDGVSSSVVVLTPSSYDSIEDVLSAGLAHRAVKWDKWIILLDNNADERNYTIVETTGGDFTISSTGILTIPYYHTGDDIQVTYWRNDMIMSPKTYSWSIDSAGTYSYSVQRNGKTMVSVGEDYLIEGVDYTIVDNKNGAWGTDQFDTYSHDGQDDMSVVLKTVKTSDLGKQLTLTVFSGESATEPSSWQLSTVTPDGFRYKQDGDVLVREASAWELSSSDHYRNGGELIQDIDISETLDEIHVRINPEGAPISMYWNSFETTNTIWINGERIEYFASEIEDDLIILREIRRGTRGTAKTSHMVGSSVRIEHAMRTIPSAPNSAIVITLHSPNE